MAKFKKVVINPGKYVSPDGEIDVTPQDIQHWAKTLKEMKKSGLQIPCPWGHQDLDPNKKEYFTSKFNSGYIEDFICDDKDNLIAILDIPREEDASRIGKTVREVSPQIEQEWRDGSGKVWKNVITHLALVTHPVVSGQENFERIDEAAKPQNALRLSLNMKKKEDTNMAEEFEKKDADKKNKGSKETKETPKQKKEEDVIHEESSSGGETLSQLLSELEKLGIVLPDDTDEKNLAEKLLPAVLTLNAKIAELDAEEGNAGGTAGEGQDLDLDALLGGAGNAPPAPEQNGGAQDKSEPSTKKAEEVPPTMTMSLVDKKRLSLVESKLEDTTRRSMLAEIKVLVESGRISPAMAQKLQAEVKKYKLSLNAKGEEAENNVQTLIEYFKMLPANATLDNKTRLSLATEQELPDSFEEINDVEAEELAEQMLKMSGKMNTYSF